MSTYEITYSDMKSAASNAKSASKELDDYMDVISKKILNKLSNLPGSDDKGYIAAATSAATSKKSKLSGKKPLFNGLNNSITDLCRDAQEADANVSGRIKLLTEPYKEKLSFSSAVRSVTGFLYNVFCVDLAGIVSDYIPGGEMFVNALKDGYNKFSHWREDVVDYFTHGDGQYIKNIIVSGLKVVGAVLAVAAVAAASSVVLAVIGVVAGGLYLLYSMGNFMATTENNIAAMQERKKGDKGLAHYYGGTSGVKDYVKKRDWGDAETNIWFEFGADVYDIVGKTSKVILDVVMIAVAVDALFEVKSNNLGADNMSVESQQKSFDNFKSKLSKEQLEDPKVQEYIKMRESRINTTQVDHDYTWKTLRSNLTRQRYQTGLDAGGEFKYPTKKTDLATPVTEPKSGINLGKLLFKKEQKMFKNIGSDDPVKKWKGAKKVFETGFYFFTDDGAGKTKNIDTIDEFINAPSSDHKKYDIGEFVSAIVSTIGWGGVSEYTGTYVEPFTNFGEDFSDIQKISDSVKKGG